MCFELVGEVKFLPSTLLDSTAGTWEPNSQDRLTRGKKCLIMCMHRGSFFLFFSFFFLGAIAFTEFLLFFKLIFIGV